MSLRFAILSAIVTSRHFGHDVRDLFPEFPADFISGRLGVLNR